MFRPLLDLIELQKPDCHLENPRKCVVKPTGPSLVFMYACDNFSLNKMYTQHQFSLEKIIMRQSACLVFNPVMVDNYAAFFDCMPVGRASADLKLFSGLGPAHWSSTGVFSFAPDFSNTVWRPRTSIAGVNFRQRKIPKML